MYNYPFQTTIMLSQEQAQVPKDMNNTTDHESEETLSLCDLPLYSDQSADWDDQDFSLASKSTTSSYQEDYFEFFSQELRPSAAAPPDNIIFCGKLIPNYKQQELEIKNQTKDGTKRRRFRWKSVSAKNGAGSTTTLMQQCPKKMYNTKKRGKARWYLFLFGVSRFSPAVELRDIRGRQSRRSCPSASPPMFGFENRDDKAVGGGGWGLWWLIRALSCG